MGCAAPSLTNTEPDVCGAREAVAAAAERLEASDLGVGHFRLVSSESFKFAS